MSFTSADVLSILPALCLIVGAFAAVAAGSFARAERRHALAESLSYAALGGALVAVILRLFKGGEALSGFGKAVRLDELALFLSLAVIAAAGLTVVLSADYARERALPYGEYYGLLLLAGAGMMLLVQSVDLITFFVSVEVLSLALYALAGLLRKDPRSNEASIKYFVMGAFASGFLLYGMALLYGATGSLSIDEIGRSLRDGVAVRSLAATGLVLVVIGLAFKVGAVPFHQWVPDVYEGSPTAVTAFMSVSVKAAAFGGALRLLLSARPEAETWGALCWALSLATMAGGNLLALGQKSVKRMLAYSSVAHTGYVLMALAVSRSPEAAGPAREAASAAVFYLFVYTFMTLGAFAFLVYAGRPGRDAESYDDLNGLAKRSPWAAAAMTVFMVSLAGIPPTAGFFGKFLLFRAAVSAQEFALVIVGVLGSAVSVAYYLRVIVAMFMKPEPEGSPGPRPAFNAGLVVFAAAAFTLLLGVVPGRYLGLSSAAVASFFR